MITNEKHSRLARLLERRHGGILLFYAAFLALSSATRVALLLLARADVSFGPSLLAAFGWGLLFDLGAAALSGLPLVLLLTVLPRGFFERAWARAFVHATSFVILYALLFDAVAEWTFWDEFGVRFNFIAVDYLVYTREVVGNIRESYDMPAILVGLGLGAALLQWLLARSGWPARWLAATAEPARARYSAGALWLGGALALGGSLSSDVLPDFENNFNRELGKDGLWALFSAFRDNYIDYDRFYSTLPPEQAFAELRGHLVEDGSTLLRPTEHDTLRAVHGSGAPEWHPNVIQITVESLSADFLSIFENTPERALEITPHLNALAEKCLVFDNFYATGTRTVRGMEALTLSLPPTPGGSLVKRPHNEDLFSLGSVFRSKGYRTAFLYGGFGYFDNMDYFFGHNGYEVIDRTSPEADVTFSNVWGACDEDLYRWTMRAADRAAAADEPFHFFVMTTSNHRPYTFPDGRIDLESKTSGRAGAVKYTDYAIARFLRDAEEKPWFADTVFVIVADHCASSAGKSALSIERYRIPLLIYAPGGRIAPGHVRTLTSQMDYAPTLLGLLGWSYSSRFFGHDVRAIPPTAARAPLGNYQHLGLLRGDDFLVLSPGGHEAQYQYDFSTSALAPRPVDPALRAQAISTYQTAYYLYANGLYTESGTFLDDSPAEGPAFRKVSAANR